MPGKVSGNISPFQMGDIPSYMSPQGGGQAAPPFLEMRRAVKGKQTTQPVVTPKPQVTPSEVASQPSAGGGQPAAAPPSAPPVTKKTGQIAHQMQGDIIPQIQAAAQQGDATAIAWLKKHNAPLVGPVGGDTTTTPAPSGQTLDDVYNFFKQDLMDATKLAKASATADAAARGVYYGTPLTTSLGDLDTQYLRGLGQLQAGMYGNEQARQLAMMQMAAGMFTPQYQGSGYDPNTLALLGQIYGWNPKPTATGPGVTPKQPGNQTQSGVGA